VSSYDARTAEVFVYTFKEGVLSALAHDLKLKVGTFQLDAADGVVTGTFDAQSLTVVCPRKDGRDNPGGLPQVALGEIEKNTRNDVLDTRRYPSIRFRSTSITDTAVEGELTLHGTTRAVRGTRRDDASHRVAEVRFDQRDFGIKPFSAMLGTLKIKPEVVVEVRLPKD
jgi:polyisoprenoid-binding protein YceI